MFTKILFNSRTSDTEVHSLANALLLAHQSRAELTVLVTYPPVSSMLAQYKDVLEQSLISSLEGKLQDALKLAELKSEEMNISLRALPSDHNFITVTQIVLREDIDLLVKEAAINPNGNFFRSDDMSLIRKCPCPVLLFQKECKTLQESKIAVALDADNTEPRDSMARDLSIELLKMSSALCKTFNKQLQIISCYDTTAIEMLNAASLKSFSEDKLKKLVEIYRNDHYTEISNIVRQAGIDDYRIIQQRGQPNVIVPDYCSDKNIDCLVLGTVTPLGILGYFIGTTAEDIIQQTSCSILAIKPTGFQSPIKPY